MWLSSPFSFISFDSFITLWMYINSHFSIFFSFPFFLFSYSLCLRGFPPLSSLLYCLYFSWYFPFILFLSPVSFFIYNLFPPSYITSLVLSASLFVVVSSPLGLSLSYCVLCVSQFVYVSLYFFISFLSCFTITSVHVPCLLLVFGRCLSCCYILSLSSVSFPCIIQSPDLCVFLSLKSISVSCFLQSLAYTFSFSCLLWQRKTVKTVKQGRRLLIEQSAVGDQNLNRIGTEYLAHSRISN